MSKRVEHSWMDKPLVFKHLEKSQPITELPMKEVWIIDDWLPDHLFFAWADWRDQAERWALSNRVIRNPKNNPPNKEDYEHLFWGESWYSALSEYKKRTWTRIEDWTVSEPLGTERWRKNAPDWKKAVVSKPAGYCHPLIDTFMWRLQQEFRFDWVRFQYCGANGQIPGQNGTLHEDTMKDGSCENNLTFLFYDAMSWGEDWGGDLIFYDSEYHDIEVGIGLPEDMASHEIGRIEYKPNRLVVCNGMITHNHPGPDTSWEKPNFPFRTSLVCRGDEVKLWPKGKYKHIEYEY